jgi:hypothetical protein
MVARYGRFRIYRTWTRANQTDIKESLPELVFEIDPFSEFDLMAWFRYGWSSVLQRLWEGEVIPQSEVCHIIAQWIHRMRPVPGGGVVGLACYRRRVGPPDGEHGATPGEWYQNPDLRRPGKPIIEMDEAVPLVEAALHELEAAASETEGTT